MSIAGMDKRKRALAAANCQCSGHYADQRGAEEAV